ncbi:MAG: CrcB family protein [Intrasporangiaceae bacterium]|nr:CrcB family protein [Intrasporangiaceae bacterium]
MTTPPHRASPLPIGAVFVGGMAGTALRALIDRAAPAAAGEWPWATFAVNITGAFLLGMLLETLARREARDGSGGPARLLLGTGLLGGYTTYSTFAVEILHLGLLTALLYATLTVVGGLAAAGLGFRIARGRPSEPVPEAGS